MIDPREVTVVIVTKGGAVGLGDLTNPGIFGEAILWDNSKKLRDAKVYGRYLGALEASNDYIYVQDDDCVIDIQRLCAEYQQGELLCNLKPHHRDVYAAQYPGISMVGWGAIFPKSMIDFSPYLDRYPEDELFLRECDRVFTWLNRAKTRVVDFGVQDLPHAFHEDRMGREIRHGNDLMEIRGRLATL